MESGFADINSARLFYEAQGQGVPVVFIHADIADHTQWDTQVAPFAQHYPVIRYDLRGHGRSSLPPGPFSHLDDLLDLLDHLAVSEAVFVGCSIGGKLVLDLAILYPERVLAVVPVSGMPSGFTMDFEIPPQEEALMEALQTGDYANASELFNQLFVDGYDRTAEQVDPAVRRQATAMNSTVVPNLLQLMENEQRVDVNAIDRLRDIRVPVLAIAGANDSVVEQTAAEAIASGVPNGRKALIANAAHLPNMEQPAEFNRLVLNFLREQLG